MTNKTAQQEGTEIYYPIYNIACKFVCDGESDYPLWKDGLPDGRIWNSVGFTLMFKEEKTQGWMDNHVMEWWEKYCSQEKNIGKNLKLFSLETKFVEFETWHLTWFQHETFDVGQTNEEALRSFRDFVTRKEILNEEQQRKNGTNAYCLMGAEDRWRWHGAEPDGDPENRSDPPCRCSFCKRDGLIRIGH